MQRNYSWKRYQRVKQENKSLINIELTTASKFRESSSNAGDVVLSNSGSYGTPIVAVKVTLRTGTSWAGVVEIDGTGVVSPGSENKKIFVQLQSIKAHMTKCQPKNVIIYQRSFNKNNTSFVNTEVITKSAPWIMPSNFHFSLLLHDPNERFCTNPQAEWTPHQWWYCQ